MRVVELPINASEDRVVGSIDIEAAIKTGEKRFEPGVLAEANRNILYVDEVNLLDDHIVDVLLDAAAMGLNTVEREGVSVSHPARFILVGTMNPEEGDLRPQLLDRFGLCVDVTGIRDVNQRVEIVERREAFEEDPEAFAQRFEAQESAEAQRIARAIRSLPDVEIERDVLVGIAALGIELEVDGHRADIVTRKSAQALAAYEDRDRATAEDVERVAPAVLAHRVRPAVAGTKRNVDLAEVMRRAVSSDERLAGAVLVGLVPGLVAVRALLLAVVVAVVQHLVGSGRRALLDRRAAALLDLLVAGVALAHTASSSSSTSDRKGRRAKTVWRISRCRRLGVR